MNKAIIDATPRDIILTGNVRYGVSRNVPATDSRGRRVLLAMAVIERDNGAFDVLGINEEKIRFHGEGIIEQEVLRRVYA